MKSEEAQIYFYCDKLTFLITLVAISSTFLWIYFVILMAWLTWTVSEQHLWDFCADINFHERWVKVKAGSVLKLIKL